LVWELQDDAVHEPGRDTLWIGPARREAIPLRQAFAVVECIRRRAVDELDLQQGSVG
jgi:hypothetical protein